MDAYLKNVIGFPKQLSYEGLSKERLGLLRGAKADGLILLGMGGSGLASEIVRSIRKELGLKVPLAIWKDYGLPDASEFGMKRPLYVFASFSGNTEETVSGLETLLRSRKIPRAGAAVIAAGGDLVRIAEEKKLPAVTFAPSDLTPRQATGKMFYSLIEILHSARLIPRKPPVFTNLDTARLKAAGRTLARKLKGKLVVIYTDEPTRDLGYFWKIRINETAKTQAFTHVVPEMNHNEIVSFEKPVAETAALFIHYPSPERLVTRIRITQKLLRQHGIAVEDVPLKGRSALEITWNMISLADWTSYFLAELSGVEPGPVPIVEKLKGLMKHR